jgi:hypothetical protein
MKFYPVMNCVSKPAHIKTYPVKATPSTLDASTAEH